MWLALRALLLNFDNDWERLRRLLVQLLERRGDWGPRLGMHHRPEQSEQDLLKTVQELTEAVIGRVAEQLTGDVTELEALTNFSAGNLGRDPVVLSTSAIALPAWRHAIDLMLKKDGDWRSAKGINKTLGFPVGSDEEKSRLRNLLVRTKAGSLCCTFHTCCPFFSPSCYWFFKPRGKLITPILPSLLKRHWVQTRSLLI